MILPYSNLQITHQNPGAENKLILPIQVICNTSDEEIFNNIRENSKRPGKWLKAEPAHDGVAVLCGSGPSLFDTLPQISAHRALGHKIFAMNGAAAFLDKHGITPDYQVLIDAREETKTLIGPAKEYLFASQVHPACFEMVDAKLWHLQVGNMENEFPDYDDDYCLIGGAASVGNTATCLAYAMGFRNLQIYGYDSSHRDGMGHAFHQKMNDGDPCCHVTFNGKDFVASLTMKLQAEKFQDTAADLKSLGVKIEVHGDGLLPEMFRNPDKIKESISEVEKYRKMWEHDSYREVSPGELCAERFVKVVNPQPLYRIVDFGCGTGRGSLALRKLTECEIVLVDFTENSRDEEAKDFLFYQCDLTLYIPVKGDYGFCTDVMEHIEPEKVDSAIHRMMESCPLVFFQISTVHDNMGALIGQPLHLTVRPADWWHQKFRELGYRVSWSEASEIAADFVVHRR